MRGNLFVFSEIPGSFLSKLLKKNVHFILKLQAHMRNALRMSELCFSSAFIGIVHNGAPGSHCVALDVQYGQGCLLECEPSPEARLITFKAQA